MAFDLGAKPKHEAAEMRAMLELGVDGIITDYPARLLALL